MPDAYSRDPLLDEWKRVYPELQHEGSADCPTIEILSGLVLEELGQGERLQLADHVVACRRCSRLYRLLSRLHDAASEARPPDGEP